MLAVPTTLLSMSSLQTVVSWPIHLNYTSVGSEPSDTLTRCRDELEGHLSTVKADYYEVLLGQSDDYALTLLFMPLMCRENLGPINSHILHMFNRNYTDSGTPQRDLYCMTVHMPNKISFQTSF